MKVCNNYLCNICIGKLHEHVKNMTHLLHPDYKNIVHGIITYVESKYKADLPDYIGHCCIIDNNYQRGN